MDPRGYERALDEAAARAKDRDAVVDDLRARVAALEAALRPFAAMAEGKDSWAEPGNCAVFPQLAQVRAARAVLAGTTVPVAAPDDHSLAALQREVHARWGGSEYNEFYVSDQRPHREFTHALVHVGIASGTMLRSVDACEHVASDAQRARAGRMGVAPHEVVYEDEREGFARRAADAVICAAQACAAYPGRPVDLAVAVADRLAEKFPPRKDG